MSKQVEVLGKFVLLIDYAKRYFVVSIIWSVYTIIATGAMSITYIVFKKLDEAHVFEKFRDVLIGSLSEITKVATDCTGLILDINAFVSCLMQ
jgi:hypothetical protein